jgi:hypothetical protein
MHITLKVTALEFYFFKAESRNFRDSLDSQNLGILATVGDLG